LDGDGQNDPADIPGLLAKLEEGNDIVCGWRYRRQDPFLRRRLPSMIANSVISWTTQVKLHDYGCTLKAICKEIAKDLSFTAKCIALSPPLPMNAAQKLAR
jgi:hypothetical protein